MARGWRYFVHLWRLALIPSGGPAECALPLQGAHSIRRFGEALLTCRAVPTVPGLNSCALPTRRPTTVAECRVIARCMPSTVKARTGGGATLVARKANAVGGAPGAADGTTDAAATADEAATLSLTFQESGDCRRPAAGPIPFPLAILMFLLLLLLTAVTVRLLDVVATDFGARGLNGGSPD